MVSDLRAETGVYEAGLDQLLQTLTGPAENAELADEQAALAVFRAHAPLASGRQGAGPDAASPDDVTPTGRPRRWNRGLIIGAALAVCVVVAVAAYARELPTAIQHPAHDVFGFAGVPDKSLILPAAGIGRRSPASHAAAGATPAPTTTLTTGLAASPSPPLSVGSAVLTATASSQDITAGSGVTITGQLSWPAHTVSGRTVTLQGQPALATTWRAMGSGQTGQTGSVRIAVAAVATNYLFRLAVSGVADSPDVAVTVIPQVFASLRVGTSGLTDVLAVSVPFAQQGNIVVLQVRSSLGSWANVKDNALLAGGKTAFTISGTQYKDQLVRVALLATSLHAGSASPPVKVPAPT